MGDVITTLAGKTVKSTTPMRKDGWYCVTVSRCAADGARTDRLALTYDRVPWGQVVALFGD